MEELVRGDVVIVPFPFSDLSAIKRRPAHVIANFQGPDIILCQITSKKKYDSLSISLGKEDFAKGGLKVDSFVRPNRNLYSRKIYHPISGRYDQGRKIEGSEKCSYIFAGR